MPKLEKMKDFTFNHSDQADALYRVMDADEIKRSFDSRARELRIYLNNLIELLNSDGASHIATLAINDLEVPEKTIQKVLEALASTKANKKDVFTKDELIPFLQGGDTEIKIEVFNIIEGNSGDGTFIYETKGQQVTGELTPEGWQTFKLQEGHFMPHKNRLEVYIDDHSHRSEASGGIIEIDETTFVLTMPESAGVEITAKYYERIGAAAEYNIRVSPTSEKPPNVDRTIMWFELIEDGD